MGGPDGHDGLVEELEPAFIAGPRHTSRPLHFALPLRHSSALLELTRLRPRSFAEIAGDIGGVNALATVGVSLVISTMPRWTPTSSTPSCQMESKIANRLTEGFRDAHRLVQRTALQPECRTRPAQRARVSPLPPADCSTPVICFSN